MPQEILYGGRKRCCRIQQVVKCGVRRVVACQASVICICYLLEMCQQSSLRFFDAMIVFCSRVGVFIYAIGVCIISLCCSIWFISNNSSSIQVVIMLVKNAVLLWFMVGQLVLMVVVSLLIILRSTTLRKAVSSCGTCAFLQNYINRRTECKNMSRILIFYLSVDSNHRCCQTESKR